MFLSIIEVFINLNRPLIVDIDDWEMSWFGGDNWRYNFTVKKFIEDLFKGDAPLQHPDHPFYLQKIEKLVSSADKITLHTQFIQKRFGGIYVPNGKDTDLFDPQKYDPDKNRKKYSEGSILYGYHVLYRTKKNCD